MYEHVEWRAINSPLHIASIMYTVHDSEVTNSIPEFGIYVYTYTNVSTCGMRAINSPLCVASIMYTVRDASVTNSTPDTNP